MGNFARSRKPKVCLSAMSIDSLTNWLAVQVDGYEGCKRRKVKAVASSYLREIEAIEAELRERGANVTRSTVRGAATPRKTARSAVQMRAPSKTSPAPTQIMYVECKASAGDRGRARICRVRLSKTGRTIYVGGLVLQSLRGSGISGNYVNVKTGIEYWVSRPKKKGGDRHWAGGGDVHIEPGVVDEYWRDIRQCDPPINPFLA